MPTTTSLSKSCISCGKTVEGRKRMKDRKGNYWCYECGLDDERKKRAEKGAAPHPADDKGHLSQCPRCRQFFPPTDMVKSAKGKTYICMHCHHEPAGGKKGRGSSTGSEPGGRGLLILLGVVVLVVGVAIFANFYL